MRALVRPAWRYVRTTVDIALARRQEADVAFFFDFVPPPYGGGNQFLLALRAEFERRGYRAEVNQISSTTRACLCNSFNFDVDRLRRFRRAGCRVVHRVDGPVTVYRGVDDGTDRRVAAINRELADATIVQSRYSLDGQAALGYLFKSPHVIHNAPDPGIFHENGRAPFAASRKIRLISTSWSDNPNKGAAVYKALEAALDWNRYEYTFVGRSAQRFDRIRVIEPQPSERLAELLRGHDIFITASLHDSCSNALVEALSCGLPSVYVISGGNPELVRQGGIGFHAAAEIPAALDRIAAEYESFRSRIDAPKLTDVADRYLAVLGLEA